MSDWICFENCECVTDWVSTGQSYSHSLLKWLCLDSHNLSSQWLGLFLHSHNSIEDCDWKISSHDCYPTLTFSLQWRYITCLVCKFMNRYRYGVLGKNVLCHYWIRWNTQLYNLWPMPNSVCMGFDTAMKTGSSRQFKRYPTTYIWVSSQLPFTED